MFPANVYYYVSKPISGGMANQMCTHLLILNRPHVTKYVRCLNKRIYELDIRRYLSHSDFGNERQILINEMHPRSKVLSNIENIK